MVLSRYHCAFMICVIPKPILLLKQTIMDTTNFPKVTPAVLTNQIYSDVSHISLRFSIYTGFVIIHQPMCLFHHPWSFWHFWIKSCEKLWQIIWFLLVWCGIGWWCVSASWVEQSKLECYSRWEKGGSPTSVMSIMPNGCLLPLSSQVMLSWEPGGGLWAWGGKLFLRLDCQKQLTL